MRIPDCACLMFGPWVLNEIWITNLSSALIGMLMSSSKLFLSSCVCETVIGIVLCCCHQARRLLYYFGKINSGIYMYYFTFEPLHLYFRMWLWFRISTKILADQQIWRKKGTDRRICIPLITPSSTALQLLPMPIEITNESFREARITGK